ncbi:hypothetical protein [Actinopolymorpha alba]|nr:hypothetical protein [Actinopolymorpha alba]
MRRLDRFREYLLWFEPEGERWVAVPMLRHGAIFDTDYSEHVVLDMDGVD